MEYTWPGGTHLAGGTHIAGEKIGWQDTTHLASRTYMAGGHTWLVRHTWLDGGLLEGNRGENYSWKQLVAT